MTSINRQDTSAKKREIEILTYAPKPIVECSIPIASTKGLRTYKISNGQASILFTAINEKHDIPHGMDRELFYWLKKKSVMLNSPEIPFSGLRATLREMGISASGRNMLWLEEALQRFFNTFFTYSFGEAFYGGDEERGTIISKIKGINFNEKGVRQSGTIIVSPIIYQQDGIPIDQNVIRKLSRSHGAQDLYVFVLSRNHNNKTNEPKRVPLTSLINQLGISPDVKLKVAKQSVKRMMKALDKIEGLPKYYLDSNDVFTIEKTYVRPILTPKYREAVTEQFGT